jgi:DNA-binding MarR family transcriptional regulator
MTRILFALGSRSQGREPGYGLVQQGADTEDARKHQTFLTAKGKALKGQIARLVRSDQRGLMKLRSPDLTAVADQARDIARDQWLSRLVAAGSKLNLDDTKLAVQIIEALATHRR